MAGDAVLAGALAMHGCQAWLVRKKFDFFLTSHNQVFLSQTTSTNLHQNYPTGEQSSEPSFGRAKQ